LQPNTQKGTRTKPSSPPETMEKPGSTKKKNGEGVLHQGRGKKGPPPVWGGPTCRKKNFFFNTTTKGKKILSRKDTNHKCPQKKAGLKTPREGGGKNEGPCKIGPRKLNRVKPAVGVFFFVFCWACSAKGGGGKRLGPRPPEKGWFNRKPAAQKLVPTNKKPPPQTPRKKEKNKPPLGVEKKGRETTRKDKNPLNRKRQKFFLGKTKRNNRNEVGVNVPCCGGGGEEPNFPPKAKRENLQKQEVVGKKKKKQTPRGSFNPPRWLKKKSLSLLGKKGERKG